MQGVFKHALGSIVIENTSFDNFSKNLLHNMSYHAQTLILGIQATCIIKAMAIYIYGIDRDNLLIFGRWVHLGMKNNTQLKFQNFMHKCFFFEFPSAKNVF